MPAPTISAVSNDHPWSTGGDWANLFNDRDEPFLSVPGNARQLVCVVAFAVIFDAVIRRGVAASVGTSVLLLALAGAMAASGVLRGRWANELLIAAVPFALLVAVRSDPRLTAFNLISALGLIALSGSHQRIGSLLDYRLISAVEDAARLVWLTITTPFNGVAEALRRASVSDRPSGLGSLTGFARGLALAVPVVLGLGWLLASADIVFLAMLDAVPLSVLPVSGHLGLIAIGAVSIGALMQLAASTERKQIPGPMGIVGHVEVSVIQTCIAILFGLFSLSQVLALAGAGDGALEAAGITYREYARQGFFQLLWVAGITLIVLLSLNSLSHAHNRFRGSARTLNWLVIGLTGVIVVVAYVRLGLYIEDDGLTPLRFYCSVFSIWIGVALIISAARLGGVAHHRSWLFPALLASGLCFLFALNLMNPEVLIAEENMDNHPQSIGGKVSRLSSEGQFVVASRIGELGVEQRAGVLEALCSDGVFAGGSMIDWNRGRSRTEALLSDLCN